MIPKSRQAQFESRVIAQECRVYLAEFLHREVRAGFTLLHCAPYDLTLPMVRRIIASIRSLLEHVHDPVERRMIEREARELEDAMVAL